MLVSPMHLWLFLLPTAAFSLPDQQTHPESLYDGRIVFPEGCRESWRCLEWVQGFAATSRHPLARLMTLTSPHNYKSSQLKPYPYYQKLVGREIAIAVYGYLLKKKIQLDGGDLLVRAIDLVEKTDADAPESDMEGESKLLSDRQEQAHKHAMIAIQKYLRSESMSKELTTAMAFPILHLRHWACGANKECFEQAEALMNLFDIQLPYSQVRGFPKDKNSGINQGSAAFWSAHVLAGLCDSAKPSSPKKDILESAQYEGVLREAYKLLLSFHIMKDFVLGKTTAAAALGPENKEHPLNTIKDTLLLYGSMITYSECLALHNLVRRLLEENITKKIGFVPVRTTKDRIQALRERVDNGREKMLRLKRRMAATKVWAKSHVLRIIGATIIVICVAALALAVFCYWKHIVRWTIATTRKASPLIQSSIQ